MVSKRILVVDDEENILASLQGMLEDEGFIVETAKNGAIALTKAKKFSPDLVLLDIWMPGDDGITVLSKLKALDPQLDVIIMSGHGTIETAVRAIKKGAFDFLEKPLHFDKVLVLLQHAFTLKDLRVENTQLKQALQGEEELLGASAPIQKLKELIKVTAPSNGWVLIQGENGTGKELVARALHRDSPRAQGKFIAVNCAAIPDELIESELFGHEKGAFTGAFEKKIGKFEQAHKGTLFLDEVGDMAPKMQAKILRALQECVITRVGGQDPIEVDIRVIAATNKDLKQLIVTGEFREDLFYRLNVIPISVPSLRDRKEDIAGLVEHFVRRYSHGRSRNMEPNVLSLLLTYSWPGNVRELKNWVERACILSTTDLKADSVPINDLEEPLEESNERSLRGARAEFEKAFILRMLAENGGNVSRTALAIGVERSHLHKKMKSYGIEAPAGTA